MMNEKNLSNNVYRKEKTMKIQKIYSVYFSPVKNTRLVCEKIGKELAERLNLPWQAIDFTVPSVRKDKYEFKEDELVVFGTPTYAGRIPNKILPLVQTLFYGRKTPAVCVVTFGNRNFQNSLSELRNELLNHDFHPFAAAAIACRHSFTDLLGGDRPDEKDMADIERWMDKVKDLIKCCDKEELLPPPVEVAKDESLEGYYIPLGVEGTPVQFLKAKPKTIEEDCDHCGICAAACPMEAIDFQDETKVPGTCIKCQACVRLCHTKAKYFDDENFLSHVKMLENNYQRRADSQFFIS